MIDTMNRNRIVNKVRALLDEGFTEIDIKVIDEGFIINPTKCRLKEGCSADLSTKGKAQPDIESNSRPPFPTQKTGKVSHE